jgi:hypothetical protein
MFAAKAALFARLAQTGLWKTYRFFAAYLAAQILEDGALMLARPGTNSYGWTYIVCEVIIGVCAVLAILEIYQFVFESYAGISTLGRRVLRWGLLLALAIAALTLYPDVANRSEEYPTLRYALVFQRALYSALLLFVLLVTAFLVWFPVPLSRNVVLHAGVFGASCVTAALVFLIRNALGPELRELVSSIQLAVYSVCLLTWIIFLTPAGERKRVTVGHRWMPGAEERLVEQLNDINATLVRSTRK